MIAKWLRLLNNDKLFIIVFLLSVPYLVITHSDWEILSVVTSTTIESISFNFGTPTSFFCMNEASLLSKVHSILERSVDDQRWQSWGNMSGQSLLEQIWICNWDSRNVNPETYHCATQTYKWAGSKWRE